MPIRRQITYFFVHFTDCKVCGLLLMIGAGACQLWMPRPVCAQINSSESRQGSGSRPSTARAEGAPADRTLFGQHCAKCHGTDGAGGPARGLLPEIPDFTDSSWQAQRSDPQLIASILDGRGQGMPAMRGRIGESRVRGLVIHVRSLDRSHARLGPEQQKGAMPVTYTTCPDNCSCNISPRIKEPMPRVGASSKPAFRH